MNIKLASDLVKEHCFTNGRIVPKLHLDMWWEKRNLQNLKSFIFDYTSFLNAPTWPQMLWHILNEKASIAICNNECCNNPVKWRDKEYANFCSVKCNNTSKSVLEKRKTNNLQKYGTESTLSLATTREKIKKTTIERYGVDNVAKAKVVKEKIKKTSLEKYGTSNPAANREVRNKIENTMLEKYGSSSYLISEEYEAQKSKIFTAGRTNSNQLKISDATMQILNNKDALNSMLMQHGRIKLSEILGISETCLRMWLYKHGHQKKSLTSIFENSVADFITSNYNGTIERSNRTLIKKELDIVLPDLNLAFECNGSFWHSENQGKSSIYHLDKTEQCINKSYQLIHIWDFHWESKQDIVKSRILSALKKNQRIYARDTVLKEVSYTESELFLKDNHLQGNCKSLKRFGLYYNGQLVAIMTFGKSRFNKMYNWELLRYCSLNYTNVIGGASKLLSYFRKNYPGTIVSYCNRMTGSGNLYKSLSFTFIHNSPPSYYYTKDYQVFESRNKYQKHKLPSLLENFNNKLSAWENMKNNGYDRIWDCGNSVWELK